ncbi:DUF488 domain-containing protein [Halalkalibacillus sediminis]|uniref:DUF488 domain-containing protein n=1 Tax=Halalkalibacillus sediminis TaxID=2018042 RepID=A0A2I0QS32_9BACI|nr:DUF488 family protein [Halalkalibacillus sediminis]PKR77152.1 DUF488 domain-containing protein [Halalkalibacillus sediminis]
MNIQLKRIYEKANKNDGQRVLVDGVWPRGVSKEDAHLDKWLKEIAPSKDLRQWFGHDPDKFNDFKKKYKEELKEDQRKEAFNELKGMANKKKLTILFATKEEDYNHAQVLKNLLK